MISAMLAGKLRPPNCARVSGGRPFATVRLGVRQDAGDFYHSFCLSRRQRRCCLLLAAEPGAMLTLGGRAHRGRLGSLRMDRLRVRRCAARRPDRCAQAASRRAASCGRKAGSRHRATLMISARAVGEVTVAMHTGNWPTD